MNPRRKSVSLYYNGVNATEELGKYMTDFSYTDALEESDAISISLSDYDGKWLNAWIPHTGDQLKPSIVLHNFSYDGEKKEFLCGDFIIDDFSIKGPPTTVSINGVSSPVFTDFKEMKRTKTWKKVTIRKVAEEVAARYQLSLCYDTSDEVVIDQVEQNEQTDAEFLKKICNKYGIGIKVYAQKIILFSYAEYEKKLPAAEIKRKDVIKWSHKSSIQGTYTGAVVKYTEPKSKKTLKCTVGKEGRLYSVNERADSLADAERIGKNAVFSANRKENTMSLTVIPNFDLVASMVVQVSGFGHLDGKYFVEKVTHKIQRKSYDMQVNLSKVIEETI